MKTFASSALAILALVALSGCGDEESTSRETTTETQGTLTLQPGAAWPGPPRASANGTLEVDEYNDYLETLDEVPEPKRLALEFLNPRQPFEITEETRPGGATVVILRDDLEDDSVRAERYELEFGMGSGGRWRLNSAKVAYQCHQGRGHQDFRPTICA